MMIGIVAGIVMIVGIAGFAFMRQPSFGRLPQGERLERIKRSPQYRDGEFRNVHPTELMTSGKGRLQTMWEFLFPNRMGLSRTNPFRQSKLI